MKNGIQLIIISHSMFCHMPEQYSNNLPIKKLNTFSEQLRFELANETKLAVGAKEFLNNGMNISEKIEIEIWESIIHATDDQKTNILTLGSSCRIKLPIEILAQYKVLKLKHINLELDNVEFARRCNQTLERGNDISEESKNSFLQKYYNREYQRRQEIMEIKRNSGIEFERFDALTHEKKIISEIIVNSL